MMERRYYVYILATNRNGTLYVGITNNLIRRVFEHREDLIDGFTKTHQIHTLVYYETYDHPETAILREKKLKRWRRDWKLQLIEKSNPDWLDLYPEISQNQELDPGSRPG